MSLEVRCIHHVAILTDDYQRSKTFYTEVLGFEILHEVYRTERDSYKLDLAIDGVYQIELFSFPDYKERASYPEAKGLRHLAFGVESVEGSIAFLQEKGIEVGPARIDEITGMKFCFFNDPNGQPLELYELQK